MLTLDEQDAPEAKVERCAVPGCTVTGVEHLAPFWFGLVCYSPDRIQPGHIDDWIYFQENYGGTGFERPEPKHWNEFLEELAKEERAA